LVVVLEQQVVGTVGEVLCQRVVVLLQLLVVGRTTEGTALRELCGGLRGNIVAVGVRDVRVRLVDHRLQLRVLADVLVRPNLRLRSHPWVSRGVDVELAVGDALQGVLLRVLARTLSKRPLLSLLERLHLPIVRASYRWAPVLLVLLVVDRLRLTKIVLVCIGQPARQVHLSRGCRVLRLAATAHDVAPLPCGIWEPCMTRHGGGRGIRKAVRPSVYLAVGKVFFRPTSGLRRHG